MGVNIHVYQYDNEAEIDTQPDWWDSFRYAGDKAIAHDESIVWNYFARDDEVIYRRPADWSQLEMAVSQIHEESRPRWRRAIAIMKLNPDFWFEFSW